MSVRAVKKWLTSAAVNIVTCREYLCARQDMESHKKRVYSSIFKSQTSSVLLCVQFQPDQAHYDHKSSLSVVRRLDFYPDSRTLRSAQARMSWRPASEMSAPAGRGHVGPSETRHTRLLVSAESLQSRRTISCSLRRPSISPRSWRRKEMWSIYVSCRLIRQFYSFWRRFFLFFFYQLLNEPFNRRNGSRWMLC